MVLVRLIVLKFLRLLYKTVDMRTVLVAAEEVKPVKLGTLIFSYAAGAAPLPQTSGP